MTTPPAPFDPNAALRDFNQYFGTLRKQYGDAGLRQMGFGPRDLAAMQASLRKLQMDPNATSEQHQQAFQQARNALAQRLTTPPPVMQTAAPVAAPVAGPAPFHSEYLASLNSNPVPQPTDIVVAPTRPDQMPTPPPMTPPTDIVVAPTRPDQMPTPPMMPPVSNFIAGMNAPTQAPGGAGMPYNPVNTTRAEDFKPGSGASVGDVLGSLKNLQLPPQPAQPSMSGAASPFDPNAALRTLNSEFGQLRDKYGVDALRAAGFTPRTLAEMQGSLRNLQLNPNATPEQHQSALGDAMARLRGYNFGTTPQPATPQPIIPQRETPEVPVGQPMPVPPQPMPVPPQPMPAQPQGYYRGGFAVRR